MEWGGWQFSWFPWWSRKSAGQIADDQRARNIAKAEAAQRRRDERALDDVTDMLRRAERGNKIL